MDETRRPDSLRQRKKERTRKDILQAAIDLFNERGYENTTIDDICDRAEYSRSTFFRYFGSKEEVVVGHPDKQVSHLLESLGQHSDDPDDAFHIAREVLTQSILELTAFAPELEAACVAIWSTEPSLQGSWARSTLQTERILADFFARKRLGTNRDPDIECYVLAVAMVGVVRAPFEVLTDRKRFNLKAIEASLEKGFNLLEAAFQAAPSANGRAGAKPRRPAPARAR